MPTRPDAIARAEAAPYRLAAAVALAGAIDVVGDPSRTHVPLCPLHALTGLWCPLCGGLRAVHALSRGNVQSALHDNAMLVLALPVVVALWARWAARTHTGGARRRWPRGVTLAVITALAAFTVLRNLAIGMALHP
ncbi:MAG TPA: DUF2752 domain-containing protein [Jatrophihabitantaceae bacterium]